MNGHSIFFLFLISNVLFFPKVISQTFNVTSLGDSGGGTLRQAITDINTGSDSSNTINLQVPGNSPIIVNSDLPVIRKNSVHKQIPKVGVLPNRFPSRIHINIVEKFS